MRVSTNGAFLQGLRLMQAMSARVGKTQQQVASGRRILRPSDDPLASAQAVAFREAISRLGQFQRNGDAARLRLEHEESALNSVTNVLQRVRELVLKANNAAESNDSRRQIAIELRRQIDALVNISNQQDGNGRFLFAGNRDSAQPVALTASGFTYNGDEGQRLIQIGETRQVLDGDSGAAVFFNIRNGNGVFRTDADSANTGTGVLGRGNVVDPTQYDKGQYTVRFTDPGNYQVLDASSTVIASGTFQSGESIGFRGIAFTIEGQPEAGDDFLVAPSQDQSMYQTVQNIVDAIALGSNDPVSSAVLNNVMNTSLQEIDVAMANIANVRTQVGVRLMAIDNQADSNSAASILAQAAVGNLEDLDFAEALSRLSQESAILEAAQQSFVFTQQLSLFNFL